MNKTRIFCEPKTFCAHIVLINNKAHALACHRGVWRLRRYKVLDENINLVIGKPNVGKPLSYVQ